MVIIRHPRHWTIGVRTVWLPLDRGPWTPLQPYSISRRAGIFIETSHAAILSRRHPLQIPPPNHRNSGVPPIANWSAMQISLFIEIVSVLSPFAMRPPEKVQRMERRANRRCACRGIYTENSNLDSFTSMNPGFLLIHACCSN